MVSLSLAVDPPSSAAEKSKLLEVVATPDVQSELDTPDGVSMELLPDGGWRIFGKGTGIYDFNDPDEIRQATKDAELRAKAAISRFMSERIQAEDSVTNLSEKTKKLSTSGGAEGGEGPTVQISKQDVQVRVESIRSQSAAILSGLITLETKRTPLGETGRGEISVVMGVSDNSLRMAARLSQGMRQGGRAPGAPAHQTPLPDTNDSEVKRAKTHF